MAGKGAAGRRLAALFSLLVLAALLAAAAAFPPLFDPGYTTASGGRPFFGDRVQGGRLDLNTAGAQALEALPGIGPQKAQQILAYREANGPFASVEELEKVAGIGPATLDKIRGYLFV